MSPNPHFEDGPSGDPTAEIYEPPYLELVSQVHYDRGGPDTCLIFPEGIRPDSSMTEWVAARGDSFIDLRVMH